MAVIRTSFARLCRHLCLYLAWGIWGERLIRKQQWTTEAISKVPSASISRRVYVRSLCYEYQFSLTLKSELITITKISHLDSLWKRTEENSEVSHSMQVSLSRLRFLQQTKAAAVDIYLNDLIDFVLSSDRSLGTKEEVEQHWNSQRNPKNLLSWEKSTKLWACH